MLNTIILKRINYAPTYTLGFIKHKDFFCFTLEPAKKVIKVDDLKWQMQYPEEVPDLIPVGKGCIPRGTYPIEWEWSEKFQDKLWELKNVPGRSEIKVHAGNTVGDTEGCILVGFDASTVMRRIISSLHALVAFDQLCHDEKITHIEIRDV